MSDSDSEIDRLRAAAMSPRTSESDTDWSRVVAVVVILLVGAAALGFYGSRYFGGSGAQPVSADAQSVAQIQQQLGDMEKRLADLEKRRKVEPAKSAPEAKQP